MKNATRIFMIMLALLFVQVSVVSASVPAQFHFQGVLTDADGAFLQGQYTITVNFYDSDMATIPVWSQASVVEVSGGVVDLPLGDQSSPIPASILENAQLWLGVQVGDDAEMTPRQQVLSVPYATKASLADAVGWSGLSDVPAGFADGTDDGVTAQELVTMLEQAGYLTPDDIQNLVEIGFLTEEYLTTDEVLSLLLGYYKRAEIDLLFAAYPTMADVVQMLTGYALVGHVHDWTSLTGVPQGFLDGVDNDTTYKASEAGGLELTDGAFALLSTCLDGQVLKFDAVQNQWLCGDDMDTAELGDIEAVSAGAGLLGGGTAGTVGLAADPTYLQRRVTGTCAGAKIVAIAEDGTVACAPDNDMLAYISCGVGQVLKWGGTGWSCGTDFDEGDISAVVAGSGLVGGALNGSAELAVDATAVQLRVSGTCTTGGIKSIGQAGEVTCSTDKDGLGALVGCATGSVPKWNGSAWACAQDRGIVSVTSSNGQMPPTLGTTGVYAFLGGTATVSLAAGQTILAFGSFGVGTSSAAADTLTYDICIQSGGATPSASMEFVENVAISASQRIGLFHVRYISGLAAGTYTIGLCYRTFSASWNNNDWALNVVAVIQY